ncbi:CLUMA_CG020445, isoform A [Clunio marinus]|uniref:Alpha-1,6-mannosyl-glycoprotein 2-beta-N-acetylglucosaminyltransferase n=1 Tax=Clunio marinus TaxID=568069 RepID=A0A1J1J4Z2_9DIPT|nr:CLUMA_CG020445, isoform A [Clunio marinus]
MIIVIQVHTRITYLRHLIVSLAQARDISKALLIFSHDFYDEEINELVQSIDFCKVMQIFYPFSIQMHPNEFPGTDPRDCKRDMTMNIALKTNCKNALYPDIHGHYREASFTQTKHHWWWKANQVFDHLEVTKNHSGYVLFLEEDHYVAEDFLHVLNLMQKALPEQCPFCNILSLGVYDKTINSKTYDKFLITDWISSKHNMGMAFNRITWQQIKSCAKEFCTYDDYNWDWSLQYTSQKCLYQRMIALVLMGPRVYHLGKCNGVHHNNIECNEDQIIGNIRYRLKESSVFMFPSNIQSRANESLVSLGRIPDLRANGGWSDIRDIIHCLQLCL